jgi:hypothetical protein
MFQRKPVETVRLPSILIKTEGEKAECLKGAKYTVYVAADRKITGIERIAILD